MLVWRVKDVSESLWEIVQSVGVSRLHVCDLRDRVIDMP